MPHDMFQRMHHLTVRMLAYEPTSIGVHEVCNERIAITPTIKPNASQTLN